MPKWDWETKMFHLCISCYDKQKLTSENVCRAEGWFQKQLFILIAENNTAGTAAWLIMVTRVNVIVTQQQNSWTNVDATCEPADEQSTAAQVENEVRHIILQATGCLWQPQSDSFQSDVSFF